MSGVGIFHRRFEFRPPRRGGVPAADLVSIYMPLIRSILEYCCVVWHCAIFSHFPEQLERVLKRTFGIIFPKQTYSRTCELADCPRLDVRRTPHAAMIFVLEL